MLGRYQTPAKMILADVEELAISALTKINEQAKTVMSFEKLNSAFV